MIKYIISFCFILLLYYDFFIMFGLFQQEHYNVKKYLKHTLNYYISNISTIITLILFIPTLLFNLSGAWYYGVMILFLQLGVINFLKPLLVKLKFTKRTFRVIITLSILLFVMLLLFKGNILVYNTFLFAVPLLILFMYYLLWPLEELIKKYYLHSAKKKLQEASPITIGITGSYGKTSVKNFVASLVDKAYISVKTPASYNTLMGITKTINTSVNNLTEVFISEMGATKKGEIKELTDFVAPSIAVITEIGPQHLESFKSIEDIIKTKFELADSVKQNNGTIFLNYDNEYIKNKELDMNKITYGVNDKNLDYNSYDLESSYKGLKFKILDKEANEEKELKTKLIGRHNIVNITGAIAVADYLKVPMKKIAVKVREIQNVKHRLELLPKGNITIIDDSYNANPISSKSAVDTLGEFKGIKIIVTPGLIELGKDQEKYNYEFGKYMADVCDYIFLVGTDNYEAMLKGIKEKNYDEQKVFKVNLPQEAVSQIISWNLKKEVTVLLENDLPDNYNL